MKKIIIIGVIIHILIAILIFYLLFLNKKQDNIENNIVKVTKEAEIIKWYENELNPTNTNPWKNISSGFFIDNNTIITVSHWVDNFDSSYTITDSLGNKYLASLVENDIQNDIAYLKINEDYKNYTNFEYLENINIWDEVCAINFALEKKCWQIQKIEWKKISSNIEFKEWDSGGILVNNKNKVIWMNVEMDLESNLWVSYKIN